MNNRDILDGISQKLGEAFGGECAVYTEPASQGADESYLLIVRLKPSEKQLLGKRYQKRYPFDIQYFPGGQTQPNAVMDEVAEKLIELLEYIQAGGDLIRGTERHYESLEGTLHVYVSYNLHVLKEQEAEVAMEALNVEQRGKL